MRARPMPPGSPESFGFLHDGPAFARAAHPAGGIAWIGADDHMILMDLQQGARKRHPLQAARDPVADKIARLEDLGIEIEREWTSLASRLTHALHLAPPIAIRLCGPVPRGDQCVDARYT